MDTTGWIDLQVNGFLGVDYSAPGLAVGDVARVVEALQARGTSAHCPTLVTCDSDIYERNLPVFAEALRDADLGEHLGGLHLEGPFLSPASRGAHPARWLAAPDAKQFDHWQRLACGGIRILTLAPEIEGAEALIRHAVAQGVVVSLGHHLADAAAIRRAVEAGATLCTHLGNGIVNTLPRHPNPIWTQLAEDALTACVIADGHHLPPEFLRVAWRAKGPDRFIVTSDSAAIAGLAPGPYVYMGSDVVLESSGRIVLAQSSSAGGATLAGSSSTMADCLRHLATLRDWTPDDLVRLGRTNPAHVLGVCAS